VSVAGARSTCRRPRLGNGHVNQSTGRDTAPAAVASNTHLSTTTAARGNAARRSAIAAAIPQTEAASLSITSPNPGDANPSSSATRPVTSPTDTSGPANTFATGETSETTPKVAAMSGPVAACAASVNAMGPASNRPQAGSTAANHTSKSRPKKTKPPTAATESWKPRSKAVVGCSRSMTATVRPNAAPESPRLRETGRPNAATDITSARTAETCRPLKTT
jgi:hypothetical protein